MKAQVGIKAFLGLIIGMAMLCCLPAKQLKAQDFGPLLDSDLVLSEGFTLSGGAKVASDGTNYLVVWGEQFMMTGYDIFGQFVDASGVKQGDPFAISATDADEGHPDIAFNGTYYLVVWIDAGNIVSKTVAPDGTISNSQFVNTSALATMPAVASDGSGFLVVWRDDRNIGNWGDIYGQFVMIDTSGSPEPSGSNFSLVNTSLLQFAPSIAYGSNLYLVTWTEQQADGSGEYDLYGACVVPLVPSPSLFPISTGVGKQGGDSPAGIDFDGTNFLVSFNDDRYGTNRLYGVLIGLDASLGDFFQIADNTAGGQGDVAFGDGEYLVVWGDGRVKGSRVETYGNVLDPAGINLSVSVGDHQSPAAAFGNGNYLVTWELATRYHEKYAQLVGYQGPQPMLQELAEFVMSLNIKQGISNSFDAKLEAALSALDDLNENNDVAAINSLAAFINAVEAQRGKELTIEQADELIAQAQAIIDLLS